MKQKETSDVTHESKDLKKCSIKELILFVTAVIFGTACSITSKAMMEQYSYGLDGKMEKFDKALFQTFGMFIGMLFALPMHWAVNFFHLDFPGYNSSLAAEPLQRGASLDNIAEGNTSSETESLLSNNKGIIVRNTTKCDKPMKTFFLLAIPSVFDLLATTLCMCGLRFVSVSIYQLLRGSGILFVALLKQSFLGTHLFKFQWLGIFWNSISVTLVGASALFRSSSGSEEETGGAKAFTGVMLILAGSFVQSMQFVFEEKVMSSSTDRNSTVPPLLLIGMEGLWGTLICVAILYPLAYYLPGTDHESIEDPFNTLAMIKNSSSIQLIFLLYFLSIFAYNVLAVLVTFMMNSIWHAILDNFRPITVWVVDLIIFYGFTKGELGESWTSWSYLQLSGMLTLLYGTAIYNAPNEGSLILMGQWWAFGANFSEEYQDIQYGRENEERFEKLYGTLLYEDPKSYHSLRESSLGAGKKESTTLAVSFHTLSLSGRFGKAKM
jgi:hypothetical protein